MRIRTIVGSAASTFIVSAIALAGPPIACHEFVSERGSVFEALHPLQQIATQTDDTRANREAAVRRLQELRAAIQPGDPVSLLKAGYWAEVLRSVGIARDADGTAQILRALEMRPNDPEYHFIAALAFLPRDKGVFQKHWTRARELAKPGSAVAKNLQVFGDVLSIRID